VDDFLPVALVHLREAEIVRLCGLARAARGQEYGRLGRVHQAERTAGTLRATVLDGETSRSVTARFSDSGLESSACTCSPAQPDQEPQVSGVHPLCEHVAALLTLWVREPEQFRAASMASQSSSADVSPAALDDVPAFLDMPMPAAPEASAAAASPAPAMTPAEALASLEHLDREIRHFLNLLALAGGSVTEHEAQQLFLRFDLGEPEAALAALERLQQHGLARPVFTAGSAARGVAADSPAGWSIPAALLERLPRVVPLTPLVTASEATEQKQELGEKTETAPVSRARQPEALPAEAGLHEARAEGTLPMLLLLVAAQAIDISMPPLIAATSQKPASRSTLDLDAALAQQWAKQLQAAPEQIRFCLALLRLVGLLPPPAPFRAATSSAPAKDFTGQVVTTAARARAMVAPERAREALLSTYRLLFARPEAEVARDLFTHWLHAHSASELLELRDAGVRVAWLRQREQADIAAENQAARQFIIDVLRSVPVGPWWSFSSLVEFVWRFQPAFLRGRQQTFLRPQWWLERLPDGEPLSLDVRAEWRQAEGRYIALLMRRALHWLGAVDLALDAQGRLKGFRVTRLGAFLLGAQAPDAAPEPTALPPALLQLQEDGALLAPLAALQDERLDMLLWWCEPSGATAEALRFRPSAERMAAALDAGQELVAWLGWLERLPPSAALADLIAQARRWAGQYGQVRLTASATVLEVGDPALLRELEMTLDLSERYVDHALASGLAVLRADAVETLVEEMRRRGYAPWILEDETTDGP